MNNTPKLLLVAVGTVLCFAGCESTPKNQPAPTAAKVSPYQNWTTSQLQSKRTQLMLASAKPDMQVDPVNGGSSNNWGSQGINHDLQQVNAELLRRDPSGKLLTPAAH